MASSEAPALLKEETEEEILRYSGVVRCWLPGCVKCTPRWEVCLPKVYSQPSTRVALAANVPDTVPL